MNLPGLRREEEGEEGERGAKLKARFQLQRNGKSWRPGATKRPSEHVAMRASDGFESIVRNYRFGHRKLNRTKRFNDIYILKIRGR